MPKWQKLQKQLKAQKEGTGPKSMKRMMRKMGKQGMDMDQIEDVKKVVIYSLDKKIVIDKPESVTKMNLQQGEVFQILGKGIEQNLESGEKEQVIGDLTEDFHPIEEEPEYKPPMDDIQLVSQQAGVSLEEAENALIEANGNLAKAILLLKKK